MKGGRTQFAILSLLRLGEMSGAEIRFYCRTRFGHFWNESYGQIYPALAAMAKAGLVARTRGGARGKSVRYRITAKGSKALADWANASPSPRIVRDELILKMFSAIIGEPTRMRDHVAGAADLAKRQLGEIKTARTELKKIASGAADFPYWALILRAGELAHGARLKWCEEAAMVLNQRNNERGVSDET